MIPLAPFASLLQSPLPWVIAAGLCVGAALSRATRRTRNAPDPERAGTRKWILACVLFSAAVIFGLLAVFVPGPGRILDPRLLWVGGIAAAAAFFVLRFRRAIGIPVVVLAIALVVAFGLFLQSIHAFTGETEIASVRAISVDSGCHAPGAHSPGERTVLLTMKGTQFSPVVKVVIFSDLLVFLGARTWYRFEGMTSFDDNIQQQGAVFRLARPSGISEQLWELFARYETRIPGVRTAQTELILKRAQEFATYGIMVENDGGVQVVQKSG